MKINHKHLNLLLMKARILHLGIAVFIATTLGLNAQQVTTTIAVTDYSTLNENTAPTTYVDSVTVGGGVLSDSIHGGGNAVNMVMPYFVLPDPMLNGGYDAGGTFDNTKLKSSWSWSLGTGIGTIQQATFNDLGITTDTLNQVYVNWGNATGSDTVKVMEVSNPTNCSGNIKYTIVNVIAVPTGDVNNTDVSYCESAGASQTITINLTGVPPFVFRIDSVVKVIETTGDTTGVSNDFELITTGATDGSTIGGGTLNDLGSNNWTFEFDAKTMACNSGKITIRTYKITGLNDRISRKSDRATEGGGTHLYYAADDQAIFTVYPTPATGNIYNIDN
ncbi:MAG: hypothetical protein ACOCVN_00660 [bacterium]